MNHFIFLALLTAGTGLCSIIRSIIIINHNLKLQKKREDGEL